ncbi:hypothetical protein E4U46_001380 [Claviceps purpurea]|nr:hypothetical protein E4U46_001380 [Claviceps purpurea]
MWLPMMLLFVRRSRRRRDLNVWLAADNLPGPQGYAGNTPWFMDTYAAAMPVPTAMLQGDWIATHMP